MKRGNRRKLRARKPARTPEDLAHQRDWFYESIRLLNDQMVAIARAEEVPLTYLKRWGRSRRSA
jgi:hypothetical protein